MHRERLRELRPFLLDVIAPIAIYFGLKAAGVGDLPALLAGVAIPAADALVALAWEKRFHWLPIYVCVTFAVTGGLAVLTDNPRVVLLKPSITSLAIGGYCLSLAARPQALDTVLTMLIARGSQERAAHWMAAWQADASLRQTMRRATALTGLAVLTEAILRAAIVFSLTIGEALVFEHFPAVIVVAALWLIIRFMVKPAVIRAMTPPR